MDKEQFLNIRCPKCERWLVYGKRESSSKHGIYCKYCGWRKDDDTQGIDIDKIINNDFDYEPETIINAKRQDEDEIL